MLWSPGCVQLPKSAATLTRMFTAWSVSGVLFLDLLDAARTIEHDSTRTLHCYSTGVLGDSYWTFIKKK
jgi:hypothetical protein